MKNFKKNEFTLKNAMKAFIKDLINDAAEHVYDKNASFNNRTANKTAEDVYIEIISRLEIILRMFDKDFNNLPF